MSIRNSMYVVWCCQQLRWVTRLWLPNRAGHYILHLWFLCSFFLSFFFFFFFFFFVADCMSTILPHMMWPYANLECRSEMCCTRLAEIQDAKEIATNSPSAHHRTSFSGYIIATKACIDNRKKNSLNSNMAQHPTFRSCSHNMVNVVFRYHTSTK